MDDNDKTLFPDDFAWGAATASYQIEGAHDEDGKGRSIWDMFCERPGAIWQGQDGRVACDHYHRYRDDVALMADIGLNAYRLSLSWPRIMPDGAGAVNAKGVDFYDRLIDALLEKKIRPWVTLFHWDYPLALHRRGGWLNPDSAQWFADYAAIAMDRFSDRVTDWFTFNEPQVVLDHGYMQGLHAPGERTGFGTLLQIGHHILLAHGRAVQVIRSRAKAAPKVGWAPVGSLIIPATEKPADVECCRKGSFDVNPAVKNVWNCAWWADPVYLGSYPQAAFEGYGADAPTVMQGDMETICQPMDFFGANIYTASSFVCGPDGKPQRVAHPAGVALNTYEWPVTPEALYWAGRFYHDRYKKPVVITENGVCITDMVFRDGKVHDPQRCEFLDTYLSGVKRALAEGVPFAGYFYWSLMDNFEWQWGYKHRFGLVHVDFTTQKRTLKDSAFHYRDIIASGGAILHAAG